MNLKIDAFTLCGPVRRINQDGILLHQQIITDGGLDYDTRLTAENPCVIAVADGMGGHLGGEVASGMVLASLNQFASQLQGTYSEQELLKNIHEWSQDIHQKLKEHGQANPSLLDMGSTLTAVLFVSSLIFLIHAGDTKLFRFRNNYLVKLSQDHSLSALTNDPSVPKNIIVNAFGVRDKVQPDIINITGKVLPGDILILCSDGITDGIEEEELENYISTDKDPLSAFLVEKAISMGSSDNSTAIVIRIN